MARRDKWSTGYGWLDAIIGLAIIFAFMALCLYVSPKWGGLMIFAAIFLVVAFGGNRRRY